MQQRMGLWAAAALTAAALAACGGGGDSTSSGSGTGTGSGSGTTPPTLTGAASDCYNPVLNQNDTTAQFDYQVSGGATGEVFNQVKVSTGATFHDASALTQTHALNGTTTTDIYTRDDGLLVNQYGSKTQWPDTSEIEEIWYDSPLIDRRFTLALGASDTAVAAMTTQTTDPLFVKTLSTKLSTTVTYQRQESVTVPAGTFTACKFSITSVDTTGGGLQTTTTSTEWIATTSGVLLKNVIDGTPPTTYELKAGSRLNGAPLQ